jgi:C-terminal processing protease CtpA/Prc
VFACGLSAAALADQVQPRAHVREIAQLIESHYYDVERGRAIAKNLMREAEQAAFDEIDGPRELASRLTDRLRRIDRHFKVVWGEPSPSQPRREARQPAGHQHGFGRVEKLAGNVGYVELLEATHIDFSDPASPVRAKADAVLAQLRDASAYILDLRSNRGGSPAMVGYLVSAFVSPKADVYNAFHTRDAVFSERPDVHFTQPLVSAPLFVLVGQGTASAAESLAYTLQACGRAVIVGEPSAGAANPGAMFATASGYSVFVPTGSPRNPITQRNREGEGVQPDVRVAAADALNKAHQLAISE